MAGGYICHNGDFVSDSKKAITGESHIQKLKRLLKEKGYPRLKVRIVKDK